MNIFEKKELAKLEKTQLIDIIVIQAEQVKMLAGRVAELEAKANTNSGFAGRAATRTSEYKTLQTDVWNK